MPQQTYWCDGGAGETEEVGDILMRVVLFRRDTELCWNVFFVVQN